VLCVNEYLKCGEEEEKECLRTSRGRPAKPGNARRGGNINRNLEVTAINPIG
jgi:hypothetical protein